MGVREFFDSRLLAPPPKLSGAPAGIVRGVDAVKAAAARLPPPGAGVGVGLGCGLALGWPRSQWSAPGGAVPRAFAGCGVGVGVGAGIGQVRGGGRAEMGGWRERMGWVGGKGGARRGVGGGEGVTTFPVFSVTGVS